jgi:hypothetical protein
MKLSGLLLTTSLATAALTGASLGQNANPSYSKYGMVMLNVMRSGEDRMVIANGMFMALKEPISDAAGAASIASDTCIVDAGSTNTTAGLGGLVGLSGGTTPGATFLDAGPQLTLRKGNDEIGVLPRQAASAGGVNLITYANEEDIEGLPTGLTLDIPGATPGFPKMTNVPVPTTASDFAVSASTPLDAVTKATTFTWKASGARNASVTLTGGADVGGRQVTFVCTAVDDGQFAFPAATGRELDSAGFTRGRVQSASQATRSTHTVGDALLLVTVSDTIEFEEE